MRLPILGRDGRYKLEARTAYGLLSTIVAIVKSDARTMRMADWNGIPGGATTYPEDVRPVCGTVGCIGGWTDHLAGNDHSTTSTARVLGFDYRRDEDDDDSKAIDDLFFGPLCNDSTQGTPSHARKVIWLIKRFQRKHRRRLLATPVKVAR